VVDHGAITQLKSRKRIGNVVNKTATIGVVPPHQLHKSGNMSLGSEHPQVCAAEIEQRSLYVDKVSHDWMNVPKPLAGSSFLFFFLRVL